MIKKPNIDTIVILVVGIVTILFCLPLFKNIHYLSTNDEWFNAFTFNHFSRICILKYHQLPLWSPFSGGGFPIIGRAYLGFLSPLFTFVLIFGEVVGLKVVVLVIYLAAATGMYYLTRSVLNFHPFAALFSALVFTLSGYLPSLLNDGNYFHTYIYFLPWALAFYLKAVQSNKRVMYMILCVAALSLILLQAGFFFVVASGLIFLVSVLNTVRFNSKKRKLGLNFRYLKAFLVIVLLTLAICAVKIFPAVKMIESRVTPVHSAYEDDYEAISREAVEIGSALNWQKLYSCLFIRHSREALPTYYVGFIPVIFFLLALFSEPKKNLKWLFVFVVFLLLSMGPLAPLDLFKLLWSSHRYAHFIYKHNKYFSIGIIFTIAILGGSFLSFLFRKRYAKKSVRYAAVTFLSAISIITFFDLFTTNIYFHKNIFTLSVPKLKEEKAFFQIFVRDLPSRDPICMHEYFYLLRNVGLINWYSNILLKESTEPKYYTTLSNWKDFDSMELNPSYKGEFYFLSSRNEAECSYFSPCKLILGVEIKEPDLLVINQNYNPGWRSTAARVRDYKGLLAIGLEKPGKYNVVLYYVPTDFWLGATVSLLTIICLGVLLIKYEIKRKAAYRI